MNLYDLGLGSGFANMTPKAQTTAQNKRDKMDFIKIKMKQKHKCVKRQYPENKKTTHKMG